MNSDNFVSLHNHSHFSILQALPSPKELFLRAKELGMSAIALTDTGTFAGTWDAFKASKETGVKLIIGAEFYFLSDVERKEEKSRRVVLLAKNAEGYRNLLTLNRKGFDRPLAHGKKILSVIDWKMMEEHSAGVICLTAGGNGIISRHLNDKNFVAAEEDINKLVKIFGKDDFALEVQPNAMTRQANNQFSAVNQVFTNYQLIKFAKAMGIRVVPTTSTFYLKKEDAEVHDVLLAVGAMQPVYSNARLKYNVPDFYLKTGEEVKAFFARNFGEDYASEMLKNSVFLADRCEKPDWIDPKFSNPTGKELPAFDVPAADDYAEFKVWLEKQSDKIQKSEEDAAYLRYKAMVNFEKTIAGKITEEEKPKYIERINEELFVLEKQGFSSYMLITADLLDWCRKNNIAIGTGRGCLTGNTEVLTTEGFKKLQELKIGEEVYTHTGNSRKILNTFKFDVENEELVEIKNQSSYKSLIMTKDHEIFASKFKETEGYINARAKGNKSFKSLKRYEDAKELNWISADKLSKNDLMYFPNIKRKINEPNLLLDFSSFISELKSSTSYDILDDCVILNEPLTNHLSIRQISRSTGLSRRNVQNIKRNGLTIKYRKGFNNALIEESNKISVNILNLYLNKFNYDVTSWIKNDNVEKKPIKRFVKIDEEFIYIIGRWVGDGWFVGKNKQDGIGIAFHSDDPSINAIEKFFRNIGFNTNCLKHKTKKLVQLIIYGELLAVFFKSLFPDYKNSSGTKHLPIWFRNLSNNNLTQLIIGLSHSDGHHTSEKHRECIDTTSTRLMLEIKESLQYLNIISAVSIREPWMRARYLCNRSFKIKFSGLNTPEKSSSKEEIGYGGRFSKIIQINKAYAKHVYDIEVEEDHSYLTTNGIVHNSVGGSMLGYLLGIHKANPFKYGLIFERFHNIERTSYPDADNDVATKDRGRLIEYIVQKYGNDKVSFISNFAKITPKVYSRDIARSLEFGGSRQEAVRIGNFVADSISKELKDTTDFKKLITSPLFSECVKTYKGLNSNSTILGKIRNTSLHAGGQIIAGRSLVGLVPLRLDKDGLQSVEYEKNNAEDNGLLKIDILGLSTLDLIDNTLKLIKKYRNIDIKVDDIKFEDYDQKTYDLITSGETFGVFQFGTSGGTIDLCKKIKPKSIEDLAVITTLARPAAAPIREDFIKTREGKRKFSLMHPSLKGAFEGTFGFGLYDESILRLGQDVAGWNMNQADRIRKMIKDKGKNPDKDAKLMNEFIECAAKKQDISIEFATKIWQENLNSFKQYTFNKAHAVTYSFLSFITAYLKAHFATEFLLANLMADINSNAPDAEGNVAKGKIELRAAGVKILPPNINISSMGYELSQGTSLLTGLDALKFVGDDAIEDVLKKRPFKSFDDFMIRCDTKKMRAPAIQALAASGALDSFGLTRRQMFMFCRDYRKKLQSWLKKHNPLTETFIFAWKETHEWTKPELFALEKYYLGESFSATKLEAFGKFFRSPTAVDMTEIQSSDNKTFFDDIRAEVKSVFEMLVKKETSKMRGQQMAKLTIEDASGVQCSLTIFPDKWAELKKLFQKKNIKFEEGYAIRFRGTSNLYENEMGIIFDKLLDIAPPPAMPKDIKAKKLEIDDDEDDKSKSKIIAGKASPFQAQLETELFTEGFLDTQELFTTEI